MRTLMGSIAYFALIGTVSAQADLAPSCLETAASALAEKRDENACEALLDAWLAIDAVGDDAVKETLEARATEIADAARWDVTKDLELRRQAFASLQPLFEQCLAQGLPSMADRVSADLGSFSRARRAQRDREVNEARLASSPEERQLDKTLDFGLQTTLAADYGQIGQNMRRLIRQFPIVGEWLNRRKVQAVAAYQLAESCYRREWYRTAVAYARTALDMRLPAEQQAHCNEILTRCRTALVEKKYREYAKQHMDAFRTACEQGGESRTWNLNGMVWKTPWRGYHSWVLSREEIASDYDFEMDLKLSEAGSKIQIVLAQVGSGDTDQLCALEIELPNLSRMVARFVLVSENSTRTLIERSRPATPSSFIPLTASVSAGRLAADIAGATLHTPLPFEIPEDGGVRFGFCVPEQEGRRIGRRPDKRDVIEIRNLVIRASKD